MSLQRSIFIASTILLAGCQTPTTHPAPATVPASVVLYTCTDGQTVRASYPDTNTAVIVMQGHTHTLHVAMSGSGARYIGDGWQWWTKGMHDGMLAPLGAGETIASATGVTCQAP